MTASCPTDSGSTVKIPLTLQQPSDLEQGSFLRTILTKEKASVDSLINTAKRLGPVAKNIEQMESAADASFESSTKAAQPMLGSTLQGFIMLLFVVSYIVLTLVTCMMVNMITESGGKTASTFVGFVILAIVLMTVIIRFG